MVPSTLSPYSRGYLPHIDHPGVIQAVTFRQEDALPPALATYWQRNTTTAAKNARRSQLHAALDRSFGSCVFADAELASLMQDVLLRFHQERYNLHAWVVMPNHVHVVVEPIAPESLSKTLHAWKGYSAFEVNKRLGRKGSLWQRESFDRVIRNEEHYRGAVDYTHLNPVKAGLVEKARDWPWSSAKDWEVGVLPDARRG